MQKLFIRRKKYIKKSEEIANCPDCGELLAKEESTIMLYGKSDVDEGQFMSNMSGSHFCSNCPVVVFEEETIEYAVTLGLKIKKRFNYGILGFVDLNKVPEEKRHLKLGTDENPIPIIGFLNNQDVENNLISPELDDRKEVGQKFDRKVGRNESCPCGSGKKYKKCCI